MYSPFRTTTPSQSEIFSVIVDWSIFHMYSPSRTTTPFQLGLGGSQVVVPYILICNKTQFETKMLTSNEINSILGFVPRTTILGFVDGKTFCLRSVYTSE